MATRTCCRWFKELFKKKKKSATVKDILTGVSQVQRQTRPPVLPGFRGLRVHLVNDDAWSSLQKDQMRADLIWNAVISPSTRLSACGASEGPAHARMVGGWSGGTFKRRCWSSLPRRSTRHQPLTRQLFHTVAELMKYWCIRYYYYYWTKKCLLLTPFVEE